ncbi:MAG: outer membrane protein transport protein [Pseudomonadota bacterium]
MTKRLPLILISLLLTSNAWASGLSKPVLIGPKAIGMGGAFTAIADDPTAIFHNPAGITQLKGHQFEIGMDGLITSEDYTPDQTAFPGAPTESAEQQFLPVPSFGYTTDAAKYVTLGLGLFFPHGNGGEFPAVSIAPGNPKEGRIYSMEIAPAVAYQIVPQLSVGATFRLVRISSGLKGQMVIVNTLPTMVEDLSLSGWGIGTSFGFLYKPISWLSIGGTYRSKISKILDGNATITGLPAPIPVSLDEQTLPTLVTVGAAFFPNEKLTVALGYGWERNSEIETLTLHAPALGVNLPIPYSYSDSNTIHLGGEYWVLPELAVRAGYAKDLEESIPARSMNRIVGDIAATEISLGVAYKVNRYTLAGTWNARFGSRTIPLNGTTNPAPGAYDAIVQAVSVGVSFGI